ncbi:MAG: sugar ABC transporter substrate-binding protein [Candidatus Gastranaerophilales bacterium]|nr:sugar ABC transporter substrate-binding protein [Candidatus Gastranaerophilales bacterium]
MKKISSILYVSLILILFLTGCGVNKGAKGTIELEFWTLQLDSFRPYITNVISQYEKENPDIKIKWVDIPFSEGEKRTLASVMSNNTPDLVNLNPDFSATLATRKALVDIKTLAQPEDLEKYIPQTIDNLSYGEVVFGIPWYLTTSVTYYNKKILNAANLTEKDLPQNYFDLKHFAEKIRQNSNVYALMPTVCEGGNMLKIFNKYNSLIYKPEGLDFNNAENIKILELYKYLYQNDLIPKESITQGHREALEQFMSSQSVILISGTNFLNSIKENSPEVYSNLGIYEQLKGNNGKSDFSMMNLIIPIKSKHPKEALKFALFLTNAKNQLEFAKLAPVFPSQKEALKDEYFSSNSDSLDKQIRRIGAQQLNHSVAPIKIQQNHALLNEIINRTVQQVLLNQTPASKALADAQKEWLGLQ